MFLECDPFNSEVIYCSELSVSENSGFELNYFNASGTDSTRSLPGYHRATYTNAWDNIDFHVYNNGIINVSQIVTQPNATISGLYFRFEGHDNIEISGLDSNTLIMDIMNDEFVFPFGNVYQYDGNTIIPLPWQPRWEKNRMI